MFRCLAAPTVLLRQTDHSENRVNVVVVEHDENANKKAIKQTINQAHHQSNQTVSKERKQTNPKNKPYINKLATPDRPPQAAVML